MTEESKTGTNYYKADLDNSRIQKSHDTEWQKVVILNWTAIDQEHVSGKIKFTMTVSNLLDLAPPQHDFFIRA